jgi:hypothetical protein
MSMAEMFAVPEKPAELAQLERFIGTWTGTAEMVSPTAAEMNEMITDGTMPESFNGGESYKWVLGGQFLMGEGWHEMPNGERANYIMFWTWDDKANKYRSWYFGSMGEWGEGSARFKGDDVMHMKASGTGPQGSKQGKGEMTFVNDNQLDWKWQEGNLFFKMKMKGSSKKQ